MSVSLFNTTGYVKRPNMYKASSATQTALSMYFGPGVAIDLLLQMPQETKPVPKVEEPTKEQEARRKQLEDFRKFSEEFQMPLIPKPLEKCEPYTYDPLNDVDFVAIGRLLVECSCIDDEPLSF